MVRDQFSMELARYNAGYIGKPVNWFFHFCLCD